MARKVFVGAVLIAAAAIAISIWRSTGDDVPAIGVDYSTQLRNLPANRWIRHHEERPGNW